MCEVDSECPTSVHSALVNLEAESDIGSLVCSHANPCPTGQDSNQLDEHVDSADVGRQAGVLGGGFVRSRVLFWSLPLI